MLGNVPTYQKIENINDLLYVTVKGETTPVTVLETNKEYTLHYNAADVGGDKVELYWGSYGKDGPESMDITDSLEGTKDLKYNEALEFGVGIKLWAIRSETTADNEVLTKIGLISVPLKGKDCKEIGKKIVIVIVKPATKAEA